MSYSTTSLIHQGIPSGGVISRWVQNGARISRTTSGSSIFVIEPNGRMHQVVTNSRFGGTYPAGFLIKISYRVPVLQLVTSMSHNVRVDIIYDDDNRDTHFMVIAPTSTNDESFEDVIVPNGEIEERPIKRLEVSINNTTARNVLHINSVELYNSLDSMFTDVDEADPNDTSKMILYGLDADKPILR